MPSTPSQRVDARLVEAGQRRPPGRDLDRVDHDPAAPQRGQGRDVVAVPEPPLDQARRRAASAARALGVDDGQGGLDQAGVGLVEDDEHVGVGTLEGPGRLGGVVEAEHRRGGAPSQDPAAGVEARRRSEAKPKARRPSPAGTGWTRNRPSVITPRVPSLPTKSWVRSGPVADRGPVPAGPDDPPVGQDHLEPDDHVLDLPVRGWSTGRRPGRPASRPPWTGPWTGASARA